jgi:hypothetical protein
MNAEHLSLYRQLSMTKIYKERFGEWQVGDKYYCNDRAKVLPVIIPDRDMHGCDLWLPPVFDPENPERCLWEMVDWSRWFVSISTDGLIWIDDNNGGKCLTEWDRLDIALIKAILQQEGQV